MTKRMNKDLIYKIVAMFNSGNVSDADNIFDTKYFDHQRPEWFTVDGPEEFKQIVKLARENSPDLKVSIKGKIVEDGEFLVVRLLWVSSKNQRETLEKLRISNGKIVEHWGAIKLTNLVP